MADPLRMLIIDDDAANRRSIADALCDGSSRMEIIERAWGIRAISNAVEEAFDCIFARSSAGAAEAMDLLNRVGERAQPIPVIVLARQEDEHLARRCLAAGAADCILPSLANPPTLRRALDYAIRLAQIQRRAALAEEALRICESHMRKASELRQGLVENLPLDCWARDADGKAILQNAHSRKLWGNFIGQKPDDPSVPEDVSRKWRDNNRRAFAGEVVRRESVYRQGGEDRTYYSIIAPMRDGDRIIGIAGANLDITDVKRTETALRDSQALLQQFMGRSPVAAYMKDDAGRFLYVNEAIASAFGIRPEDWVGRTATQIWPSPLGDRVEASDRAVIESGLPAETVETYPHGDAEHTWLVYRYPLTDAHGRRVLAAIGVDVTERQRAQQRLRETEERYRTLFEQSQYGVYVVDPQDGGIVDFNQAAHRQLGYERSEFGRLKISDLDLMETPEQLRAHIARIMREGSDEFETRLRAQSGEVRDVLATCRRITIGGRVLLHTVVQDITERNRLKEQLLQSHKMEAIGRLAGGVAHDFNNLLAVISGYSESMARRLGPDSPLRLHAEEIQKAAERGGALTRQLLAFSRRQIVRPQVLDLNRIIANLHDMLRRLIPEEVKMLIHPDAALPRVRADQGQMEQVLLNLAINARDAMPGGGRLTIETRRRQLCDDDAPLAGVRPGVYAELVFKDSGVGMDAATAARAFEPFFTTKEGKGTGLGLSIVYGIVQQCGGNISLQSEPQRGSTFTILFPAAVEEPDEPGPTP
jgi:two-component system cell cycle sensor histidine kinase/response regulator CckA